MLRPYQRRLLLSYLANAATCQRGGEHVSLLAHPRLADAAQKVKEAAKSLR